MTTAKRIYRFFLPLLFWLLVWEAAAWLVGHELLLPGPLAVLKRFFALTATALFWQSALASLARIGLGYLLALLFGVGFAIFTTASTWANLLLSPLLRLLKTVPVASFIVLALLWLSDNVIPGFISFLMVLPMVWANVSQGFSQTDPKLLELGAAFGLSRRKVLTTIKLPAARPYFVSAAQTGLGFAWKAGVAAEVLATPGFAIGSQLYRSKIYFETADLFAWTLLIVLLSLLLEGLCNHLLQPHQRRENRKW